MMNLDDLIVNGDSECLILRVMDFQRKSQAQAQASGFMAETEKDEEKKEKVIGWPTVCRCLEFLRANKADVGVATAEEAERVILNGFPRIYSDNAAAAASDGGPERQAASFYRVVREWLSAREWAISDVRGDGNCFFRSLVRALFRAAIPSVSASGSDDVEGSLAQYLREETDKMKIYQDYVAADEGDQRVMGQPGVWADAVQVAKASQYLEVPIHVVRCDDPGLRFNSDSGEITPSPLYQYGNNFDEPPFVLLYDPFPGHYHAIVRADADREVLGLNDLVKCLEDSKTRKEVDDSEWVMHVCSMFFALEGELSALQSQAGLEQCRLLMRAVRHFKNMLAAQHPSLERLYALCAERPLLSVPVKLFSELYFDPIAFAPDADNNNNNDNDNDLLDRGSGPISVLYAKAQTIAATAFDSHHHQNEQQQQQQQQQPPPLPPRPPKKKAQQQQQPVKRDPKLLISFEKATPENWVSAIIGNGDGRALDIEGACVNDSALEALFTAVEQRLVTVPCLVLDSCIINGDGVRRIVEFCRKNYSMCPVFLQKCTTSPAVEKLLLSEVVAGLSVEKMSYNAAVI